MAPARDGLVRFTVDERASLFTVQAFASGIASVVAHSPKFAIRSLAGHIQFAPATILQASLELTSDVASFEIMDEVSKEERREIERVMFHDVLQKQFYPKVAYRSTNVVATKTGDNLYRIHVMGDLTLHGTTRGLGMEAQVVIGEDTLRAQGSFSLMQTDYGLNIASIAGGAILLKDELRFSYFIIGRKQAFG
jgi:polyisoprenoid-binding protein YceI